MAKQTIISRFFNLFRASTNSLLDQLEDPVKALDQQMRDYDASLQKTETAVAQTIGNLRMAEHDQKTDMKEYEKVSAQAASAMKRVKEAKEKGDMAMATQMSDIARNLVTQQVDIETSVRARNESIIQQTENVEKMKGTLNTMRLERKKAERRKNDLASRANMVQARKEVNKAIADVSGMSPLSEMNRIESMIRKDEGLIEGHQELTTESSSGQMGILETLDTNDEIERRMAALGNGETIASPLGLTMAKSD